MKQKKAIFIFFIIQIILLLGSNYVSAENKTLSLNHGNYTIKKYDININVNENNTLDITEIINVNYNTDSHEFIRKIPLKNIVKTDDGSKISKKANISNIIIGQEYSISKDNGYELIKIKEDPSSPISKTYTIKYTYDLGEDIFSSKDKFYYNLIGDNRDYIIGEVNLSVTMPKEFEASRVKIYVETEGILEPENLSYIIKENTITSSYKKILNESKNLIIDIDLDNHYFVGANINIDILSIIVIIVSIALAIISYILWVKFGRNKFVAEIIDSTLPEELNSAEAGYILKGYVNNKSIASLLLYLANKGYIKIENNTSNDVNTNERKSQISIVRLKEYNENNEFEKIFMEGIFPKNIEKNEISYKELRKKFYRTSEKIKDRFDSRDNKTKIYEQGVIGKANILMAFAGIIFGLINIKPTVEYMGEFPVFVYVIFHIIALLVALRSFYAREKIDKFLGILLAVGFEMVVWSNVSLPVIQDEPLYLASCIISVICIIIIALFIKIFSRRTKYGNEMLGRIKGFKQFIENVNEEEIDKLCKLDENYFYNVLPYAYSIECEKKLIQKFEKIELNKPDWYITNEDYSLQKFNEFLEENMKF